VVALGARAAQRAASDRRAAAAPGIAAWNRATGYADLFD
jgi:hypothetical protein